MEKRDKIFLDIGITIILTFSIWFFWSFVGDYLDTTGLFGDYHHKHCGYGSCDHLEYGVRHILWNICWLLVSCLMVARNLARIFVKAGGEF